MTNVDIPLGSATLRRFARELKELANNLNSDYQRIGTGVCEDMLRTAELIAYSIPTQGNDAGVFRITDEVDGAWLHWNGEQIAYLEFGTGAEGANDLYQGPAMAMTSYRPVAGKETWEYFDRDSGELVTSTSWAPYAPMYTAAQVARLALRSGKSNRANNVIRKEVADAFTSS